ncbi:MAG: hypothetical protein ABSG14_12105 [Verrucomicrobiia bacterium]|jgi:hypothetical protein
MTNPPPITGPTGKEGEHVNNWLPFLIEAGKIAAVFAAGYYTHFLTGIRDKRHRFAVACGVFRSAFAPTVAALQVGRPDQFAPREREDTAIVEFRPHLPGKRRVGFDAAGEHYHECRKRAYPEVYDIYGKKIEAFPRNQQIRDEFAAALTRLLSYADKT